MIDALLSDQSLGAFNSGGIISYQEGKTVPKVFETGRSTFWLALSPDDQTLYSATQNGITAVSTATGTVTSQMLPGVNVYAVAVSFDGSTLYALSPSGSFTVLNSSSGAIKGSVAIPSCNQYGGSIALEPAGGWAFVMLNCGSAIPINLTTLTASAPMANTSGSALAVTPSGAYLYAGAGNSVSVIDLATSQVAGTIPFVASSVAFSPNGKWAYLAGTNSSNQTGIGVVNTSTMQLATFAPVTGGAGGGGESIAVSSDGLLIYVGSSDPVTVVNAVTLKVVQSLNASAPFVVH